MKITTLSIVAGTAHCNAACPFCVSKMTVPWDTPKNGGAGPVDWRNFAKAVRLARIGNCTTVLLTGKGEPTLYPDIISGFLALGEHGTLREHFPFIELQTNAIPFARNWKRYSEYLREWYEGGLSTVAVSVVHWDKRVNEGVYTPGGEHFSLEKMVHSLHSLGLSVRITAVLIKDALSTPEAVSEMIGYCKANGVEQLTLRPVNKPIKGRSGDEGTSSWVRGNGISKAEEAAIRRHVAGSGQKLMTMPHGAVIYDVGGQNVCLTDCLSVQPVSEETGMRQLIFYPSGRITYDWQFEGAVLL